jgi:HD-GYP domain-containing protein (c-di-GMP phosphodiesterase class II)
MTSDRSYRKAVPVPHAIAQLILHRGLQFDPVVVDTLLEVIRAESPVSAPQRWRERPLAAKRAA